MDIDEPAKTFSGEVIREATYPITLHISASQPTATPTTT